MRSAVRLAPASPGKKALRCLDLTRRLARLEASEAPSLRQHYVWLDKGGPIPEAELGEQLTIYS